MQNDRRNFRFSIDLQKYTFFLTYQLAFLTPGIKP